MRQVQFPDTDEQKAISVYFKNLDHLITLHQSKAESWKNKKNQLSTISWEQRKLSEVVTEIKRTDEKSDAPVMMITAENGFINQSERYSTNNAGQSLKKYILLEKGELAYNHGASKLRPYGSCFALTTEEKARIPFVYHCFSTETENSEFLSIVLNGKAVEKQLRRIVSSGARMDGLLNISFDEYTSIPVMLPRKDEQDRIAEYFKNLDHHHHITLHQRKYEKLQIIKKSMLENCFPKNGEKVPKIRFSGFTGDWEQRKLGDLMDIGSVKRVHQSDWRDSGVRFLRARDVVADFNNEEPDDYLYIDQKMYEEYSAQSGKVQQGDLLVTGVGTIGIPMLIKSEKPLYFKDGNIIWFKNKNAIDGQFFYYSFISKGIQDFIKESAGIGTVGTYTIDSGKKTPINLPTSIEEQKKIGIYFKNLDNLITLHQSELEKLQKIKKSLLERMFV